MQGLRYKSRSSSSPHWGDVVRGSDSGEGTSGTSIPSFLPPTLPLTELRISPPAQTSGSGRWSEVEGIHKRAAELRGWAELGNVAAPLVEAKRPPPMASSSGQEGRSDFAELFSSKTLSHHGSVLTNCFKGQGSYLGKIHNLTSVGIGPRTRN